jgi:7-cyano-7-deazaguanine tRNA-ribosyltransferase
MGKLPFDIHALGSPTEVMERYRFDILVDMIMTAKMNLPINRPLHLFGAGHPFMLALAVALGCDLFDSAAYVLYAKQGRYMTESGTSRIGELDYFPCSCPKCAAATPGQILEMGDKQREVWLAEHNLYVCAAEMRRIKQAIREGRLWELVQMRAHGHPSLLTALKRFRRYEEHIEKYSPSVKSSGLFFFDGMDLARPEIVRYRRKLREDFVKPRGASVLLLLPQTVSKPFNKTPRYKQAARMLRKTRHLKDVQVCFYCAPFGVVPVEIDEVYPLSQHETSLPLDVETIQYVVERVYDYVSHSDYQRIILFNDRRNWGEAITEAVKRTCREKKIVFGMVESFKQLQKRLSK